MQRYWFGDIEDNGECRPFRSGHEELVERCRSLEPDMRSYVPLSQEKAVECSGISTREEYIGVLRKVCIALAREKIATHYSAGDLELIQMVRMLNELDHVINLLVERGMEWYIVQNPDFSRKYRNMNQKKVIGMMRRQKRSGLSAIAAEIDSLADRRTRLMKEISKRAEELQRGRRRARCGTAHLLCRRSQGAGLPSGIRDTGYRGRERLIHPPERGNAVSEARHHLPAQACA